MSEKIKKEPKAAFPESLIEKVKKVKLRIVGIGGGGGNIVSELSSKVNRATFLAVNTDLQALKEVNPRVTRFQIGKDITFGLGTGMNPEMGEIAAKKEEKEIRKFLAGQDLVILVASLGGGVGSGASPVFAKIAKSSGSLSLGIFTLPFSFEGEKKMEIAQNALEKIRPYLNAFLVIPNEKIFQIIEKTTPLKEALSAINQALSQSLEGLIETIYLPGLINIDFADLRTVLAGRGKLAYLTSLEMKEKENSLEELIKRLLSHPLYPYGIKGAKGVILNIAGSPELKLALVSQISKNVSQFLNPEAKIIFGLSQSPKYRQRGKITLFAVGCKTDLFQTQKIIEKEKQIFKVKGKIKKIEKLTKKTEEKEVEPKEKTETKIRKNALELKKEIEKEEKEILAREQIWQPPTFLRKKGLSL
jgi:cell division protein FtsZ